MVVRFGAALCGAALVVACFSAATAKSANSSTDRISIKKAASRKATKSNARRAGDKKSGAAANKPAVKSADRIFSPGRAPFLCKRPEDSFTGRFLPAQRLITNVLLAQPKLDAMGNPVAPISGTASMYNPYRPGYKEGGIQTASGELYDPAAWTAAIQTDLRDVFGGVRYGKNYQPVYALVEGGDKQVIVKINDVGPLVPGRVIDLNQQVMHYFDPSLERGLIHDVKITPLPGKGWVPGPVEEPVLLTRASQTAEPPVY